MDYHAQITLMRWWESMNLPPEQLKKKGVDPAPSQHKAQLKRCETADQAMLTEGFRALWQALDDEVKKLASANDQQSAAIEMWAAIALLLAHVKKNAEKNLASSAGAKDKSDKSVVSELRFAQLQGAKTPEDFVRRLRRIIQQLGGEVNVQSLAQNIEQWFTEQGQFRPRKADKRISVQWAMDYYSAASSKSKAK